jgi:acetyl-CoA synthetase
MPEWPPITKTLDPRGVPPHLVDYGEACRRFTWDGARRALTGLPGGGLNMAYEAVDRHAVGRRAEQVALRFLRRDSSVYELTYAALAAATARFANVLTSLGIAPGAVVFALADRMPELYVAALGTLKHGSVFSPLFSAFGPEPIRARVTLGEGRVLVTTPALYRAKVQSIRAELPSIEQVLLVGDPADVAAVGAGERMHDLRALLAQASPEFTVAHTTADTLALLHFTSGTTGRPKGAMHVHGAVVAHQATGQFALDLHDGDVFWCTADPGWVTGTSYGILAPLVCGVTSIVDEGDFDAERWYRVLETQRVSVWYTAPTAIRMLIRAGAAMAKAHDLAALRFMASVGEPLNADAVVWGVDAIGKPIHDNWWQTETGGIMIANYRAMTVRPGSMGKPLPGIEAALVQRAEGGGITLVESPDEQGELALRAGWPSMFRGYLHEEARYAKCFVNGWYLTGDLARRDADGYYWFVGRSDDVIKSSGHLIGPFEVESVLLSHPAVAEAAVIGVPDAVAGELVKAFVVLKPGESASDAMANTLRGYARTRLGAAVAPKAIAFVAAVPKTRSGKILRRLLKARELGLPEGDLSTLEGPSQ